VPPDNSRLLVQAAKERHERTLRRADEAIRRLDEAGGPINFQAVAGAAGVSRSWLYRQPAIRAEIDRLRCPGRSATPRVPSVQRASVDSMQRRLELVHDEIRRLREENRELREQAAKLLGEQRFARWLAHPDEPSTLDP
jgi:hypothetical protein